MNSGFPGPAPSPQFLYQQKKLSFTNQFKSGANWFYFIAGMGATNTLFLLAGSPVLAILGLSPTQMINTFILGLGSAPSTLPSLALKALAFLINLLVSAIFILPGFFAHKRVRLAFILGMLLYAVDGFGFLASGIITAFAFHLFGLYGLWRGFSALGALEALEKAGPPLPEALASLSERHSRLS